MKIVSKGFAAITLVLVTVSPSFATTKGLNQIVTPDIQPQGTLSISYQQQDPNIANPSELQFELGITKRFEAALFQGLKPAEEILNVEYGIIQGKQFLLSTGFAGYSSRYPHPAPYLEAGYQTGNGYVMAGVEQAQITAGGQGGPAYNQQQSQTILGAAYHVSPRMLVQFDYQSGEANCVTGGFTYTVTPTLTFNPAIYYSNSAPHNIYGYSVLTWNVQLY
jgi:hypothetical protein